MSESRISRSDAEKRGLHQRVVCVFAQTGKFVLQIAPLGLIPSFLCLLRHPCPPRFRTKCRTSRCSLRRTRRCVCTNWKVCATKSQTNVGGRCARSDGHVNLTLFEVSPQDGSLVLGIDTKQNNGTQRFNIPNT